MGLENEIAEAFQQAIEHDLERISHSAMPDYHPQRMAPHPMVMEQRVSEVADSTGQHMRIDDQDYQVVRVDLNPLGRTNGSVKSFQDDMDRIRDRRLHRKVTSTGFETEMNRSDYHAAFHHYFDELMEGHGEEGHQEKLLEILPRHFPSGTTSGTTSGSGQTNPDISIICFSGVDYVSQKCLKDLAAYDPVRDVIKTLPFARVDLWPEVVVIRDPTYPADETKDRTYIRGDLVYFDPGDPARKDLRFHDRPRIP